MTTRAKTGVNSEVYYAKLIAVIQKWKKQGKEITRDDLNGAIVKTLGIKYMRPVVLRLIKLGIIEEEKTVKIIIKVLN